MRGGANPEKKLYYLPWSRPAIVAARFEQRRRRTKGRSKRPGDYPGRRRWQSLLPPHHRSGSAVDAAGRQAESGRDRNAAEVDRRRRALGGRPRVPGICRRTGPELVGVPPTRPSPDSPRQRPALECESHRRWGRGRKGTDMRPSLIALAALCASSISNAQVAGTMSSSVRAATGASVPGATITALLVGQQLTRTTVADATGFYNLLAMPPGVYDVTAESPGFEGLIQKGAELTMSQNLRLDVTLKVGAVQQEITVASQATLVDTTSQTLSSLVDGRRVQDLPLNGRNIMSLTKILPGILNVTAPQELANTRGGPSISANGRRSDDNNYTFNGANFTHFAQTTGMNFPAPDSVQAIRGQTHNI